MISLVLVYCLAADGKSCIEKRPMLEEAFSNSMACMVAGEQVAADFLEHHPGYRLSTFRCEINKPRQEDI